MFLNGLKKRDKFLSSHTVHTGTSRRMSLDTILRWPKSPGWNAEVDNFFQEPKGSLIAFSIGRFLVHFSYIWVKIARFYFVGQISQVALNRKAVFEVKIHISQSVSSAGLRFMIYNFGFYVQTVLKNGCLRCHFLI